VGEVVGTFSRQTLFRSERIPTPADFGLDVTIAIAAITVPEEIIVLVSDRMISFGDVTQADENAIMKTFGIHPDWLATFSADNIDPVLPMLEDVRRRLSGPSYDQHEVQDIFSDVYAERIQKEFLTRTLAKYGYSTIQQFRIEGRNDLGDHFFDLCRQLDGFDLRVQFIVCGYDKQRRARIFEIDNPGRAIDHNLLCYAVAGSGYHMATASLRRKPMKFYLDSTIYRLLEAKFSAETASGVGRSTTVILKSRDQISRLLQSSIEQLREIWKTTVDAPDPPEATTLINGLSAVDYVAGKQ
jgi:20S proteasome alpha/beta subunit